MNAQTSHPFATAQVKGTLVRDASLKKHNWFRTDARADWMFTPVDAEDLRRFLRAVPGTMPVTVIGGGSNLLIREGGVEGVVITLGAAFADIAVDGPVLTVGAGAMDVHVARAAQSAGLTGLEFLVGIPGTIGGAVAMNAGAYGTEIADRLIDVQAVTRTGDLVTLTAEAFGFGYRRAHYDPGLIFLSARLRAAPDNPDAVQARMDTIIKDRAAAQPIGVRTGGSTFKNPGGLKAWQLIDAAGFRGKTLGGAQISEKHCNFLVNLGGAKGSELEALGNAARDAVKQQSGTTLEWEIRRIGRPAQGDTP